MYMVVVYRQKRKLNKKNKRIKYSIYSTIEFYPMVVFFQVLYLFFNKEAYNF